MKRIVERPSGRNGNDKVFVFPIDGRNPWDALTVALVRRAHQHGELPTAVIHALMAGIGLPL